jgi:hypothetical protein
MGDHCEGYYPKLSEIQAIHQEEQLIMTHQTNQPNICSFLARAVWAKHQWPAFMLFGWPRRQENPDRHDGPSIKPGGCFRTGYWPSDHTHQGLDNLWAMEIDSDRATQEYIDRAMEPIRAVFPEQMVQVMEEQMSGPCTSEVAAFDRFTDFLDAHCNKSHLMCHFDTAPTGHTIRLLELPAEWSHSIDEASAGSGQTCLGPAAAIQDAKHKYERALAAMRNSDQTQFVFVLHPEAISIKETRRAIGELSKLAISKLFSDCEQHHSN